MKGFLITVAVLGAIIYGMLQINEYYDDRGACGFGFTGGEYRHEERLDNVLNGFMREIIERDKNARKALMKQQGKSEVAINKTIKALEPKYNREREKMAKYCYLDFEKEPYFQKKSMEVKPSDYCEMGNRNNGNNSGGYMGYVSFRVKYKFDDESSKFFNEVSYVVREEKDNTLHIIKFNGMYVADGFSPCETRYVGRSESSDFYINIEKEILKKLNDKKHIYNKGD